MLGGHRPDLIRAARPSRDIYQLSSRIFCGLCDRRMTGSRNHGRNYYRCWNSATHAEAVRPDHPTVLYVREDKLIDPVDQWIVRILEPSRYAATVCALGPCVAPHPSTLGAALLAYEATVDTDRRTALPIAELFGDGTVGTHDHQLEADELLTRVTLPAPVASERAAYVRATSRAYAEWPLAEAVVRLSIEYGEGGGNGTVAWAAVAVGGVAPVSLRMPRVEAVLIGQPVTTTLSLPQPRTPSRA